MKWFAIIVLTVLVFGMLFMASVVYGAVSIEGFQEILTAGLDGLKAYFNFLIDVFSLIL